MKGYNLKVLTKNKELIAQNKVFETENEAKTFAVAFQYFTHLEVTFDIEEVEHDEVKYIHEVFK